MRREIGIVTVGTASLALLLGACQSPDASSALPSRPKIQPVASWKGYETAQASSAKSSTIETGPEPISYYERRLLAAAEKKADLEQLVRGNPDADEATVQYRFREIAGEFQSLIADNPGQIEARLLYGKFLDFFGDREGASEQFIAVLGVDPTVSVAYQQLGNYFAEDEEYGKALAHYLSAIENDPDESVYHLGLGEMLFACRDGFLKEAGFTREKLDAQMIEAFRRAAELAPDSLVIQFRYGEAFYDLYDPDWTVALAHWERLGQRSDLDPVQADAVQLHEARCLGELERYDAARKLAAGVTREGLAATKQALLDAIDEAEARGTQAPPTTATEPKTDD